MLRQRRQLVAAPVRTTSHTVQCCACCHAPSCAALVAPAAAACVWCEPEPSGAGVQRNPGHGGLGLAAAAAGALSAVWQHLRARAKWSANSTTHWPWRCSSGGGGGGGSGSSTGPSIRWHHSGSCDSSDPGSRLAPLQQHNLQVRGGMLALGSMLCSKGIDSGWCLAVVAVRAVYISSGAAAGSCALHAGVYGL